MAFLEDGINVRMRLVAHVLVRRPVGLLALNTAVPRGAATACGMAVGGPGSGGARDYIQL